MLIAGKDDLLVAKSTKPKTKTKKLDFGDGSVYYVQSRKSYVGQVTIEIDGEKIRKTAYGKAEKIVKNKLLEYRIQAKAGNLSVKDKVTFYQLADKIIEEQFALNEIRKASYDRKMATLDSLSLINDKPVKDITDEQIKRLLISKIEYSQSYLNKIYQLLNVVFNEALRKKIISASPMQDIKKPKSKQELIKVRALTIDEQKN